MSKDAQGSSLGSRNEAVTRMIKLLIVTAPILWALYILGVHLTADLVLGTPGMREATQ